MGVRRTVLCVGAAGADHSTNNPVPDVVTAGAHVLIFSINRQIWDSLLETKYRADEGYDAIYYV